MCCRFSALSDSSILDLKQDSKILDSNYNEILDRIAKLGESDPSQFEDTSHMMDSMSRLKIDVQVSLDEFQAKLQREIAGRDLSKDKIQNASLLGIKLPRF